MPDVGGRDSCNRCNSCSCRFARRSSTSKSEGATLARCRVRRGRRRALSAPRRCFRRLKGALRPGGFLVYETFTRGQAQRGKPTNPAFLLEPGELRTLVAPLEILFEREGDFEGKMLASVIARRRR